MKGVLSRSIQGPSVVEHLLSRLADDEFLTLVDVGARNGIEWPGSLVDRTHLIAFEANLDEFDKLIHHEADAQKIGITVSEFGKEIIHNVALWKGRAHRFPGKNSSQLAFRIVIGYPHV